MPQKRFPVRWFASVTRFHIDKLPPDENQYLLKILGHQIQPAQVDTVFLIQILYKVYTGDFTRQNLADLFFLLQKANNRKVRFYSTAMILSSLGEAYLSKIILIPDPPITLVLEALRIFIGLANVNLKYTDFWNYITQEQWRKRILELSNQPEFMVIVPNIIYAISKLNYQLSADDEHLIQILLQRVLASREIRLFLQKRLSILWVLAAAGPTRFMSHKAFQAQVDVFVKALKTRTVASINTKFATQLVEVFGTLYPASAMTMRLNNNLCGFDDFSSDLYSGDGRTLWQMANRCMSFLSLIKRASACFHPVYVPRTDGGIIFQKKIAYGNPSFYESTLVDRLRKRGYHNVRANVALAFYEVDLLVNDTISVEMQGSQHHVHEIRQLSEKLKAPRTVAVAYPHASSMKRKLLAQMGIEMFIEVSTSKLDIPNEEEFRDFVAQRVAEALEAHGILPDKQDSANAACV